MSGIRRHGDLEINEDHNLQKWMWSWQRVVWIAIAATLACALFGLFGGGPFGRASVRVAGRLLEVRHDRFSRRQSPTSLEVLFRPDSSGVSRIWLSREYVLGAGVRQVTPEPEREIVDPAGSTYVLAAAPGDGPVRVLFRLDPERAGPLRARVKVGDGPSLSFTQFVYP